MAKKKIKQSTTTASAITNGNGVDGSFGHLVGKGDGDTPSGGRTKLIILSGTVGWWIDLESIVRQTSDLGASDTAVFFLNSGGGSVVEGLAILNYIKLLQCKTISLVAFAASMMTQIALACDEVHVFKQSLFMIHNAQGVGYGDYREMNRVGTLLKDMNDMLALAYTDATGKSSEDILTMMDADTYLFGTNIVDNGFAASVLDIEVQDVIEQFAEDDVSIGGSHIDDMDEENTIDVMEVSKHIPDEAEAREELVEIAKYNLTATKSISDIENAMGTIKNCIGNCEIKLKNKNSHDIVNETNVEKDKIMAQKPNDEGTTATNTAPTTPTTQVEAVDTQALVAEALAGERARVAGIMAVAGINDYLDNPEVTAMLADGTSTASDVGAKLYGLLQAKVNNQVEQVKTDATTANDGMESINTESGIATDTDNKTTDDDTSDIITPEVQALIDDADIVVA